LRRKKKNQDSRRRKDYRQCLVDKFGKLKDPSAKKVEKKSKNFQVVKLQL